MEAEIPKRYSQTSGGADLLIYLRKLPFPRLKSNFGRPFVYGC